MVVKRNPERTRDDLLNAAFMEIHRYGFRAASLDRILANTGVTKGALYHHFPNKLALGYAVVDELIRDRILSAWVRPLEDAEDPLDRLIGLLGNQAGTGCELGCPLNNLAQEMSPVDEGFRQRLNAVFGLWRDGMAEALRRGQTAGRVRPDVDPQSAACFLLATFEGAIGLAKTAHDPSIVRQCRDTMIDYLRGLQRAAPASGSRTVTTQTL